MTPRKTTTYLYYVTGTGAFPIDMLRADRATPRREEDSGTIERSMRPRERGPHTVSLQAPREPNEARWRSFGWSIEGGVGRVRDA